MSRRRLLRSLRSLFALAPVLALAQTAACHRPPAQEQEVARPAPPKAEVWISKQQLVEAQIKIGPIDDQDVGDAVAASGRVTFDDQRVAHVYSPLSGRVSGIDARLGDRVHKGAPLAVISSPDLGQASADLSKAEADLVAAEHDFKRKTALHDAHAASAADLEASEDGFRKAKAERDRAAQKAKLLRGGEANAVTQGYTLVAPIDGEVIARAVSPGVEVQGQYGGGNAAELFTIGELDKVWVLADLFEMDLQRVKVGAKVSVSVVAYPGRTFEGTVDWVSGSLDPTSRTVKVRCVLANPDRALRPEMYATVRIAVGTQRSLAVSRTSVLRLGDELVVWVEKGETPDGLVRFERVPVAVEDTAGSQWYPLVKGPERGTRIVTSGGIILVGMLGSS
jgi:cobalt-zinc-cadmium efflux system membrane fusion protein